MKQFYLYIRGLVYYIKWLILGEEKSLTRMTYGNLYYLSYFSKKHFISIKSKVITNNINRLREKSYCKVGFVIYTTSMWSLDGLYHLFDSDPSFQPYMLIAHLVETTEATFQETKAVFAQKGYRIETPLSEGFDIDSYNLLIYTTPYPFSDECVNSTSVRFNKLLCYVSYSYILSAREEKLNLPTYLLSWKLFCDSPYYKQLVEEKSRVYSNNAVYCGYPKMDSYYEKIGTHHPQEKNKKIIIYAPHHSVTYSGVKSATFEKNAWYLLYLAYKYRDYISWIIKPHPLLRSHSVMAGIFNDEEGYNDYLKRWKELNGEAVVENGDYMDLFIASDAMITDSISFLAEYQFTGHPLLLLESGLQTYNNFGEKVCSVLYRCSGNDFVEIERFINDLIVDNDPMKSQRQEFFNANLSYYNKEKKYAYEEMFDLIRGEIFDLKS